MDGVLGLRNEIGRKHGIRRYVHLTAASCGSGVTPAKPGNLSLGALYTVLAMLGFAGMDAMSKWLVADYAIGQLMWIRYAVFFLFAWVFVPPQRPPTPAHPPPPLPHHQPPPPALPP